MTENLIFIRALQEYLDQFEILLGDEWPEFQVQLQQWLDRLIDAESDDQVSLIVDEIIDLGLNSPAAGLVRTLLQQASEEAGHVNRSTPSVRLHDPESGRSRNVPVALGVPSFAATGAVQRDDVIRAGHLLAEVLTPAEMAIEPSMPPPPAPPPPADLEEIMMGDSKGFESGARAEPPPASVQTVQTHPTLQGPDIAYLNQPYRLTVKLSDQPQPSPGDHVSTPEFDVPVDPGEVVKPIQVKLLAPDFELDPAEAALGWQRDLDFYVAAASSNAVIFTLLPQDRFGERYFAAFKVQFLAQGQVLGEASRQIEVLQDATITPTPLNAFPQAPGYPLDERGEARLPAIATPVSYRPHDPLVDLTVTITESQDREQLFWEIVSPYLAPVDYPPSPYVSRNLGAEEFVNQYLAPFGMPGDWPEDHMDLDGHLKHLSIRILFRNLLDLRNSAPAQFWTLYQLALQRHETHGHFPTAFTILFRTADTHIPWELMPIAEETQNGQMPLLLGSAHNVGRWLLEVGTTVPESNLDLMGFTLAAPTYTDHPLPEAEAEQNFIRQRYAPRILADNATDFIEFMETGEPTNGTGVLHFAGHGDCCTDPMRRNWLVLTNREALYDINSASTDLGNRLGKLRPTLAFFNACNVGRAAPGPLGSNGGWGRALLHQQYKGYVGPLWSVYDKHARDICQTFYTLALDQHLPLGEVMRQIRSKFSEDNRLFTYLAYLYLGHPLAQITYTPFDGGN